MARKTIVRFIDDIDGTEISDADDASISFSMDGVDYEIDLAPHNADKLRSALAPFIKNARRVSSGRKRARGVKLTDGPPASVMRAWARENGIDVPLKGVIPPAIREAYAAAQL